MHTSPTDTVQLYTDTVIELHQTVYIHSDGNSCTNIHTAENQLQMSCGVLSASILTATTSKTDMQPKLNLT